MGHQNQHGHHPGHNARPCLHHQGPSLLRHVEPDQPQAALSPELPAHHKPDEIRFAGPVIVTGVVKHVCRRARSGVVNVKVAALHLRNLTHQDARHPGNVAVEDFIRALNVPAGR